MGTFLVFLIFGFPAFFIFWVACSSIIGGRLLAGLFVAILFLFLISFVVIFLRDDKTSSEVLVKIAEDNNKRFHKKIENNYGKYFLIDTDQKELLFETSEYDELSGYVTLHYTHGRTDVIFKLKDIHSCVLHKATKIIKKCSIYNVSSVKTNIFSMKYTLEIQYGEKYITVQSDDIGVLMPIYDVAEYIITKGESMKMSPFSKLSMQLQ